MQTLGTVSQLPKWPGIFVCFTSEIDLLWSRLSTLGGGDVFVFVFQNGIVFIVFVDYKSNSWS